MHGFPGTDTVVEENGHIGHGAVLHGCRIKNALIGMNAVAHGQCSDWRIKHCRRLSLCQSQPKHPCLLFSCRHPSQSHSPIVSRRNGLEGRRHPHLSRIDSALPSNDGRNDALTAVEANRKRIEMPDVVPLTTLKTETLNFRLMPHLTGR